VEAGAFDAGATSSGEAGAFCGVAYLCRALAGARDVRLRDATLHLLAALAESEANAAALVAAGGAALLLRLACTVHTERRSGGRAVGAGAGLLEDASDGAAARGREFRFWACAAEPDAPLLLSEIAARLAAGTLREETDTFRAEGGEGAWAPLAALPQLAWTVGMRGVGGMSRNALALLCLRTLRALCDRFPARDAASGLLKVPPPRVRAELLVPENVALIAQA
jgi:hypothetical protein